MPTDTFHNLDQDKQNRIIHASVQEFAQYRYVEAKLSRIIKAAKIPRGSFYQYFEDKKDLYKYLFDIIAQEKIKYLSPQLANPQNMAFMDLFRELYKSGLNFAIDNPEYVKITQNLMSSGGELYRELIGDGLQMAREFYMRYIDADKAQGRIREDIDSLLLADIVIESISRIAIEEFNRGNEIHPEAMLERMEGMINILQKGIE